MANDQLSSSGNVSTIGGDLKDREISKEDMIDILGQDDDVDAPTGQKDKEDKEEEDEEDKDKIEDKDEEDKETDEDKEEEIKLKDEDEEDSEVELVTPFKKKELLKKYPTILKEFPYLEKAYYRDQQFTETFATPADAKEAAERLTTLDAYETNLSKGNTTEILAAVKEHDKKAFNKLVDNYMGALQQVDSDAHIHVVSGIVKNLVVALAREAKKTDNDELRKAAIAVNKYAFDTEEYEPHKKLSDQSEEVNEVEKEREQWTRERFEASREETDTKVENVLKSTITQHIDPKELMTDYVKKTAIKDAIDTVIDLLDRDASFRRHIDSLWGKAFTERFSKKTLDAIKSAYLSKAKTVLPQVIRRARNDALKGLGKRVREERDEPSPRRGHLPPSRTSASSRITSGQQKQVPKGMTTLDYLNQD